MKWTVGTKIGGGFAVALTSLVIIGIVSFIGTNKLTSTAQWVNHTHLVLEDLSGILQALTDAETGQRGYIISANEAYLQPYSEGITKVHGLIDDLRSKVADNPRQQRNLETLSGLAERRLQTLKSVLDLQRASSVDSARQSTLLAEGKQEMDGIREVMTIMRGEEERLLAIRTKEASVSAMATRLTIIIGTIGVFGALLLIGYLITRNIARPLQEITAIADRIAEGDLSAKITKDARQDEVGMLLRTFARMLQSLQTMADAAAKIADGDLRVKVVPQSDRDVLGNAFATMVANLQRVTAQMTEGVNVLSSSANQISTSTTQMASTASQTATAVSEATTTVEEVRQTAQVSSQKSKSVSESAQKMAQISQGGLKSTEETIAGINRVRQQMTVIADSMVRLSEQSQTIGQIVATVEDLAAQSNILAVNASMEAARAGEHGKGFAVVAQEVRSLAEQSKQATNQVRTILTEIQRATSSAVMVTEQGSKAVEAGVRQAGDAGQSIQTLSSGMVESAQAATQIAASSQQQLVGVDQVASAMESIKQASTQNVTSAKQLESAAHNLKELGHRLKLTVEKYRV